MTEAQIRTLDASMDDWSETKRRGMQWVFEKYVLPGSPEALESIPVSKDPRDRPGYFRPGNWDWTMTKLGEYEASLYSPPSDELPKQRFPQVSYTRHGIETFTPCPATNNAMKHKYMTCFWPETKYSFKKAVIYLPPHNFMCRNF